MCFSCGRTGRAGKEGFAWTFVTPEQGRYAGEILRALELSGSSVPDDLRELWNTYKTAQESEGKKVHSGGGFSGKGFKFDEQEAAAVKENKKMQKAALGLQDSDDDEDIENDIDQQIESMFAAKRNVKEIEAPLVIANPTNTTPVTTAAPPAPTPTATPSVSLPTEKLELARRLASKINIAKNLGLETKGTNQNSADTILKGAPTQSTINVSL